MSTKTPAPAIVQSTGMSDVVCGWIPPAGLTVEVPIYESDCVMLGRAGVGWVTVDMHRRFFGLGYGRPRRWSGLESCLGFTGRGWQKRLLTAAAEYLQAEFPELAA